MNRKKLIILIIIFVLIIICLPFVRKMLIVNKIKNEAISNKENPPFTYFMFKKYNPDGVLNGNVLIEKHYLNMDIRECEYDITINVPEYMYILFKPEKIYAKIEVTNEEFDGSINKDDVFDELSDVFPDYSLEDSTFKLAKNLKISTSDFDGKDCYVLAHTKDNETYTTYIDKKTLILAGFNIKNDKVDTTTTITLEDLSTEKASIDDLLDGYKEVDYDTLKTTMQEFQFNKMN